MMVIVTGPLPASDDNVLQERVKVLRRKGVNVLVVGVGNVNTDTLQRITSDKRSTVNRVLLARDYAGIVQYVKDIPDFGCSEEGMFSIIVHSILLGWGGMGCFGNSWKSRIMAL